MLVDRRRGRSPENGLMHGLLHQDTCTGEADLATVIVLSGCFRGGGRRGRRPRRRTRGPLPPSSAVNGTRFLAAGDPDRGAPWQAKPVTRDTPQQRMRHQGSTTSSPIPWTTLKTPGGNSASAKRSASSEHESGDHSAGFEDDGAAGCEGRRCLPGREHKGGVPGGDHGRRSGRHALHAVQVPGDR